MKKIAKSSKELYQKTSPGVVILCVTIAGMQVRKTHVDTGASVNIIPLSGVKRIRDLEIETIVTTLQMMDNTQTKPVETIKI